MLSARETQRLLAGSRQRESVEDSRCQAIDVTSVAAAGADTPGRKDKRAEVVAVADRVVARVGPSLRIGAIGRDEGECRTPAREGRRSARPSLPLPAPSVFRAPSRRLRGGGLRFVQPAPAASRASGPAMRVPGAIRRHRADEP
jgi:hypothetical protein